MMKPRIRKLAVFVRSPLIRLSMLCIVVSAGNLNTAEAGTMHANTSVTGDSVGTTIDVGATASYSQFNYNGIEAATANVELLQNGTLNMGVRAYASYVNQGTALSTWTDTISISGGNLPQSISMNFGVDATMQLIVTGGIEGATVGYTFQSDNSYGTATAQVVALYGYGPYFNTSGDWSSATYSPLLVVGPYPPVATTTFSGEIHQTILLNKVSDSLSTTNFRINLQGSAGTESGSALLDASHTLKILSVTNVDGSPLTGDTITFDSGMQLPQASPTPAPSSLVMSAILFGIFGVVWSCKRLKRTTMTA